MAVKTEAIEKNLSKITFEVSREDFEKAINKVFKKNAKNFNIPGFRKGKAPKAVVEKYYTEAVFYDEAINDVLPEAYESAVKESGLDVVAKPEIDVEEIKKGEPVVFTALVTTKPEVELGEYKGIEVSKIDDTVTDEDVEADIKASQQKNARLISVDDRAVENGDIVVLDFDGYVDDVPFEGGKGEGYELEIGSNTFIPGFEEQLVGVKIDENVDVKVTFPTEYHAENLAGKDAVFKCVVHEIKVRELPELDDDFASEVSEFDTMDEFRADVRKKLEEKATEKAKTETENAILEKVVEGIKVDVPDAMVEANIDNFVNDMAQRLQYQGMNLDTYLQYTGQTMEQMREQFKDRANKQILTSLAVEAIAKKEGIEATEEEVEAQIAEMAKQYNMEVDKIKELLGDSELENIKKDATLAKTVAMIVDNAVIK
ncbi:MAG: trigger factor [Clostridia bacterium]|nr:trigger factor [Clostridia bacterium]